MWKAYTSKKDALANRRRWVKLGVKWLHHTSVMSSKPPSAAHGRTRGGLPKKRLLPMYDSTVPV